jgi:hypothetical protein
MLRAAAIALALICGGAQPSGDDPVALVELHGAGNQPIDVNPALITSIRSPLADNRHHFAKGTRCVVVMINGYSIAVQDTCEEIRRKLAEIPPPQ